MAAVTRGTFHYRAAQGWATLAPGALLLGNPGGHFECRHEHGVGDRCLSFDFDPDYFEEVVTSVPGARRPFFTMSRLSPSETLFQSSQPPRRPTTILNLRRLHCELPALPLRWRTARVRQGSDLLIATGRIPNTAGVGLDRKDVAPNDRGYIAVNDRLETSAPTFGLSADGPAEIKPDRLFYVLQHSTTRRRLFVLGDLESNSRIDPPVILDFSPIAPHFSARVAPNNGLTARHQNRL